jgi:hypothetical protein
VATTEEEREVVEVLESALREWRRERLYSGVWHLTSPDGENSIRVVLPHRVVMLDWRPDLAKAMLEALDRRTKKGRQEYVHWKGVMERLEQGEDVKLRAIVND